ncbi:MAG: hypothetical protein KF760_11485 [Candidatus Eremiobacteraeota bacterium]|nr:hypothetical protein [Candidatus Eremiobacteraeota bacterium]MCW5868214.1 hypothetical protein [Candidatus Eremiobacteraeota bacterium]
MSSNFKKFTLAAGLVLTLGYLAGCGTRGENTGFGEEESGPAAGLGTGGSTATGTATGSGLTGGATGTATPDPAFPSTVATGLTVSNMLPAVSGGGGGSGASNPPTRLGMGVFSFGTLPVVLQGFGNSTLGSGRVTILSRNPESPSGTSNIVLAPNAGTASPLTITNPFGMLVDGSTIYVADNASGAGIGRLIRYTNIQANGQCTADQLAINLNSPVDIAREGNFLYVAELGTGAVGRISRIDLTAPFPNSTIFVPQVNFCTSLAVDTANGHRFLYFTENAAGSSGSAQGGVIRIDLANYIAGSGIQNPAPPPPQNTGVQLILPETGATAYNNPFDLATDAFSNLVITEGLNVSATGLLNPTTNPGALRVVAGGATPAITSKVVLQNSGSGGATGLSALRGIHLFNEDTTGAAVSVFFTEGNTNATATTLRQVTFRTSDAAIFRHLQLDNGKLSPLDTLFDAGDTTATPVVRPNVKYCVGAFGGGSQGQVLDLR